MDLFDCKCHLRLKKAAMDADGGHTGFCMDVYYVVECMDCFVEKQCLELYITEHNIPCISK